MRHDDDLLKFLIAALLSMALGAALRAEPIDDALTNVRTVHGQAVAAEVDAAKAPLLKRIAELEAGQVPDKPDRDGDGLPDDSDPYPDDRTNTPPKPEPIPGAYPHQGSGPFGLDYLLVGNANPPSFYSPGPFYNDAMKQVKLENGSYITFVDAQKNGWSFDLYRQGWTIEPQWAAEVTVGTNRVTIKPLQAGFKAWFPRSQRDVIHPDYEDKVRRYSVVRMMDMNATNHSGVSTWAQRSQAAVSLEDQIALVVETGTIPWFNIPHAADADYVRRFAQMVKERIPDGRPVFFERSNEVWNSQFGQHGWFKAEAARRGWGDDWRRAYAASSVEMFTIAREVLGTRAVRVVGGWAAKDSGVYANKRILAYVGKGNFDALAITCYFGDNAKNIPADATVDGIFSSYRNDIVASAVKWKQNGDLAASYGVPMIAYEGAQHVTPEGRTDWAWYGEWDQFNRSDPRWPELYDLAYATWKAAGGTGFTQYTDVGFISRWGAWGAAQWIGQPITDKERGLDALIPKLKLEKGSNN